MKKLIWIVVTILMLSGCVAAETFETISDVYSPQEPVSQREIVIALPENAAMQVLQSDAGKLYLCEGFELALQTFTAGDLNATLKAISGRSKDALNLIETGLTDAARYECVWSAVGEAGDIVARTAILDDGYYHYCLTVTCPAGNAGELRDSWNEIFQSFTLGQY